MPMVIEGKVLPSTHNRGRYTLVAMNISGVLVGMIVGGMGFRGGREPQTKVFMRLPQTPKKALAAQTDPKTKPAFNKKEMTLEPQVYRHMLQGEKRVLNGELKITVSGSGCPATLQLAPDHYEITLQSNTQNRT